jgi:Cys-tRNA(Pro)/Cys-tRNA(Cys) deacylase
MTSTPASIYLDSLGIPYAFFEHSGPAVGSLEQAAVERGQQPEQVVRSILFRLGKGQFCLVLAAGPRQVSWPALRRRLGQRRLTMASPEEVLQVTGYKIGAVSPFGLPQPVQVLVDRSVLAGDAGVSLGSGRRGLALMMQSADVLRALPGAEVGDFLTARKVIYAKI